MYGTAHLRSAKDLLPLQAAFEAAPHDVKTVARIARFFAQRRMMPGAITYMQQALGIDPDNSAFHRDLGGYFSQVGRHGEALYHLRRALALNPKDAEVLRLLGKTLCSVKQIDVGVRVLSQALALPSRRDLSLSMLAKAYFNKGDFRASVKYAEQAAACGNGSAFEATHLLANVYSEIGDFNKAIFHATKATRARAREGYGLLAGVLSRANLPERAAEACRRALRLEPKNPSLHFMYAWSLLILGDYERGWEEYEWRLRSSPHTLDRGKFRAPLIESMWAGEKVAGKTILVHGEQGFGDNIQFIRYVQCLMQLGATVNIIAPPPLVSLFSRIRGVSHCGAYMDMMPRYDYHIVVGSLPRQFTRHMREIPNEVPYLTAPKKPDSWFRVRRAGQLNVGICWGGNKLQPADWRAIDIDTFAGLFSVKEADFYSLQVGPKSEEIEPYLGARVFDLAPSINDFSDTAAILERLDVLVSVDSGIAHLAGALGRKVFTVLPFTADWRWLKNDRKSPYYEVTPWYPTMHLFRQPRFGDWGSVLNKVMLALTAEAKLKDRSRYWRKRDECRKRR